MGGGRRGERGKEGEGREKKEGGIYFIVAFVILGEGSKEDTARK